jgi:hypothetical protein
MEDSFWKLFEDIMFPEPNGPSNERCLIYLAFAISSLFTLSPPGYIDLRVLDMEYWMTFYEHRNSPVLLLPPDWATNSCGDDQIAALRKALGPNISDKNHFGAIVFGNRHFWFVYGNKTDIYVLGREISDRDNTKAQRYEWKFYQNHRKEDAKLAFNVWSLAKRLLLWTDADRPNTVYLKSWGQNGFDCGLHAIYMAKLCMVAGLDPYNLTINRQSELLCTMHGRSRLMDQAVAGVQLLFFKLGSIHKDLKLIVRYIDLGRGGKLKPLAEQIKSSDHSLHTLWSFISGEITDQVKTRLHAFRPDCTCDYETKPHSSDVVSLRLQIRSSLVSQGAF